ncbi:hypothetical protein N7931_10785 [Catenovulum sp. 2E275]|uniref:hypothetical protein n=1 Tax=Catenovulum sp. 2E275 TaxID=2980497 RepID=UPI0021D3549D|nr:hypothetical protein [Catenovulum sp. 2E275]MCU4676119.1 hypothetical protein [Catenovulum sp. 2E275]
MFKSNKIIFALIFVFLIYRVVELALQDEKEEEHSYAQQPKKSRNNNQTASQERFLTERLSEDMPKIYSWQRLLQIYAAQSEDAFKSYLSEWFENNPVQLFNKAFLGYKGGVLTPIQSDIIQEFTLYHGDQTLSKLDMLLADGISSAMELIVCKTYIGTKPQSREVWLTENITDKNILKQCFN